MAGIQVEDHAIIVDADVIGHALGIEQRLVQPLIREGRITTLSERGTGDDAGTYRLTFFYQGCRARLIVSDQGQILQRTSIDFGEHATSGMVRRSRR